MAKIEATKPVKLDDGSIVYCAHKKIVALVDLVKLKNPQNPNTHPKEQLVLLGKILHRAWRYAIVVSTRSGLIVKGHGRCDAAILEGLKYAPVDYQHYDSEEDELADLIADNRIAELSERDKDSLKELLEGLDTGAIDMDLTGYDNAALEKLMTAAPPENAAPPKIVFDRELIIEAAFKFYRQKGFPYRALPLHICMQQLNKLANTDADSLLNSDTAYHVADTFHPHRFHGFAEGKKSPFVAFADDKLLRRALGLAMDNGGVGEGYLNQLSIVAGTQACSNFRPAFAMKLYKEFCKKGFTVLDTSTGYGGRLIGFIASGMAGKYIGIDPSTRTHAGNDAMAKALGFTKSVDLHNLPVEDVPANQFKGQCDFAFTSPPYYCKEHYCEEDTQSFKRYTSPEQWMDGFLMPMLRLQYNSLKKGRYAIVNIADVNIGQRGYKLTDWTIGLAAELGFDFVEKKEFPLSGNAFGANLEAKELVEPVFVFRK